MSTPRIAPIDAELALAEMQIRREQVVRENLVPSWFWSSIGVLMVVFVAAVESQVRWILAAGVAVYAVGLTGLILLVVRGRARVRVRPWLLGVRGFAAIFGFAFGLVAVGLGLGFTLDALGVPFPATVALVPVAVGTAAGGPRLMAYLRRLIMSRPLAGSR